MNVRTIDFDLVKARRGAGLTQAEVAKRMGTTQSAVSRVESGRAVPSLDFLDRFARALGRTLTLELGAELRTPSRRTRVHRGKIGLGGYVFNPWLRNPTPAEQRSLEARGLTRERFEGAKTPR